MFGVLAFAANCLCVRIFQLRCARGRKDTDLFQAAFCTVGAVAYLASAGFEMELELAQGASAVLYGIFFASATLFSAACFQCGPMSVTSVIGNSSVVIPVLYSCVVLKEDITAFQIAGLLLLLVTFSFGAAASRDDGGKRVNVKWLVFLLIYFFSNGASAVVQKVYKLSANASDGNTYMSVAYMTAAAILALSCLRKTAKEPKAPRDGKTVLLSVFLMLAAGLGSFIGNGVLMKLSTEIPAGVLYPFINGGLCVTVAVCSILLFREKMTLKKALTIFVGLAAVIILNL